ncbi:neuronal cell adhesion molecule-like isoform X1 [Simochromis diagramma]|uniref:neuronal cell adhesion molecule-like isoform X1 n=1 Tax=Simochromis diagramma TaxID=43689 RepID=UPI001A7E2219|nr:neuronal cell adhesion molecule-like isoform X1 [Simochromis diagramma]XP_039882043.1 neuronal cell adhesion molecule-like isoform X1 [Simochromis diagramma]XP_039882044.1 neuronal cell adhesion molecule-like isoform X1 [Simochromis diagramma]XP_039882045.1 neuronal cell adhesion molecule-like isoform X1 [Simochromis diagramma]XP_039882046.1 neuronal cell adhesion molecule-like isoform X1 [Simochromis diagramma]XP_039882047.1 neuronal cell adhesion molecule-like isoform X1 [Simochromis diag
MEWRRMDVGVLLLFLVHLATALEVPLDLLEGLPQPPTITYQSPKDYIVDPRENIIIHCEAKGKPHPSFSWTRNGTHFDIENDPNVDMKPQSGTLVVDISRERVEHYEGVYQCTARNKHGTAVSHNIVVRQSRSPLWSKEKIKPIVVQEGVSLVLPCRPPAGLPPPIIFWMDNNFQKLPQSKRVSQSLNGDLYFSNVRREDTRNDYICYARFPHTQTIQQKQPITVRVLNLDEINDTMAAFYNDTDLFSEAPVDDRRPTFLIPSGSSSSKMVLRGDKLEMECIAEGLPTPHISWTKISGDLPSKRTSFLNYNKTLHIEDVSASDEGDYRCTAKNQFGSVHHTIHVMVKAAPYWIDVPPRNLVLAPGESGRLSCLASGTPKPTITWAMNGISIENSPKDLSRKVEDDIIIFTDVQPESSAVYQCNISNEYGYVLSNAFVNVLSEPPRVLTPPNKVYQIIKNHQALLDCSSFGSPMPKITWFKDSRSSILQEDPYILHDNGTLEIHIAQAQHNGKYTCVATNSLGIYENHVYLEVKEPTRILKQPEYKEVQRGRSVVFECTVKHDPSLIPTMTWLKDDGELPDDERLIVDSDSLTITDVTEDDAGVYTCIMNTTLDHDSATAKLTVVEATTPAVVYERPDPPTDLELTDQKKRSVQLTWTPGDEHNSPVQKFLIQYEDSLHHRGHWRNLTEVPGTKTTAHLKLSPHVHYTFRVLALNAVGFSNPSRPSRMYKTEPAAPDENPTGVQGFGTEHNNLVISWKPLTNLQSNGPGLHYRVMWRQKKVESEWNTVTVSNNSKFVVSGTPTFVPYEIKVRAVNDHGAGPDPAIAHGYSGEDLPVAAPENVHAVVRNSTLVEVFWDPVPAHLIRGNIKGYKVSYWRKHHYKHNPDHMEQDILVFSGNHTQGMLPGLHPFSLYLFNVRVYNGKGEGPRSVTQQFKTPEGVPGSPTSLIVTNSNLDSLTLEWSPPHDHNGHITGYTLKYQPVNNSNELGPVEELALAANETSVTLPNLKYSIRYKFYLNAKTGAGAGAAISQEAVIIREEGSTQSLHPIARSPPHGPPHKASPFGNISSMIGEDWALISWEYWGPEKNFSAQYRLNDSESEEDWNTEFVNGSQNITLKGLKGGLCYRVRLVALGHHDQEFHHSKELLVTLPAVASRQVDIATQGWFIGLMCAIALLILILLIICFIQRNKGGKYPVKEKEDAHTDPEFQPMKDDDCTFVEYSDNEDHKPLKGSRSPSNGTVKRDDSDDSLVDYGEGGDGQFNEDGSFIGQYSGKSASRDTAEGHESSEAPSPIKAMNSLNSFV